MRMDDPRYRMPPLPKQKILFIWSLGAIAPSDLAPLADWNEELAAELALESEAA